MLSNLLYTIIQKFSFVKRTKIYNFCKEIIFPFLIYNISCFYKDQINEKLIIMGAFSGGAFVDNTKYIFKFLNERSDYKVIWVAKFKQLLLDLKKKGYNVVPSYSFRTIQLLRRAKFIFMTHGLVDILPIKFSPKTIKILTWHGTPLKNIDVNTEKDFRYNGWGDKFHLNLKYNDYTNYLLTATKNKKDHMLYCSALQISYNKLIDFGYPKNDILFNNDIDFINRLKRRYNISENVERVILYAPTWRSSTILEFPISNQTLINLNNFLENNRTVFLIKAHMVDRRANFRNYKNIFLIDKTVDIQELVLISDLLITDYSSVYFDYLLTLKPIIFFAYDLKDYKTQKGFYYDYEDVTPGPIVFNGKDLLNMLSDIDRIDKEYYNARIKIRDQFFKYIDDKSTERLLNFLNIEFV